jgi:NAD(P)-dependent dehydrogenase (short-subunit alcohol dehydrogenase family)
MEDRSMNSNVILITGATGGLGSGVTSAFIATGARVAAVSRKAGTADTESFHTFVGDMSNTENANSAVKALIERWGRIDALVHLVGGFAGGAPVSETSETVLEQMFDINFKTAFYMIRAVIPVMREQGSGRIIAVGSRAAVEPTAGVGVYAASKAALVSLIRSVAIENKDRGITANVILPGTMDTPANRAAMPNVDFTKWVPTEQVARLMVHLVSDEASAINGAVIPVYGGEL